MYMTLPLDATHVSMAEARANLRELLDNVKKTHARYTITRNGEPDAILISVEDFEAILQTMEILGDPELMAQIKQGQAELDRGEGIPLDQVRQELGL